MCQGVTKKGHPCKRKEEPYCRYHGGGPQLSKFQKRLNRGPTKADGPGYIYVYFVDEVKTDYYKIGSSVEPEKRVKDWGGIVKKIYYVHFRQFAERLIHIELDAVRVFRYKIDDGKIDGVAIDAPTYCTVWKATNEPVEESDAKLKEIHQLHAFQKNVEWFKGEWGTLEPSIGKIINLVNDRGYRRN